MATIDTSIVNVAMPQIRGELGASLQEITWVTTAYLVAMVLVMPLTGFLGSFFGQKRVYIASLVLFTVGSVLCGTARSLEMLVLWRILQGIGGGELQPTQQAILRQTFPRRSGAWRWPCSRWSSVGPRSVRCSKLDHKQLPWP